jgi:tetratricopeptide (TPR) repeat protein
MRNLVGAVMLWSAACAPRQTPQAPLRPPTAFERQVRNAVDAGDGDLEVRRLRARVAAEPDNLQARLDLAAAYTLRGFPDLSLEHMRLAAARFPDKAEAQLALALALRQVGLHAEGAALLQQFLTAYPQTIPRYAAWLGILRDELGEWKPGESAHRAALAAGPEAGWIHNNLGHNLLMQGRAEEAAAEFREALRLDPSLIVARNNLGIATAANPAEAVLHWQSVADPAAAHSNLAALLIEQGQYEAARRELAKALGYNSTHPAAWKNLRLVARLDGKPATLDAERPEGRWSRFGTAVRKVFIGHTGEKL